MIQNFSFTTKDLKHTMDEVIGNGILQPNSEVADRFSCVFESSTPNGRMYLIEYGIDSDYLREIGFTGQIDQSDQSYYELIKQKQSIYPPPIKKLREEYFNIVYGERGVELATITETFSDDMVIAYLKRHFPNILDKFYRDTTDNKPTIIDYLASEDRVRKTLPVINIYEAPVCDGCKYNLPGQMSHMTYGGCLYIDIDG